MADNIEEKLLLDVSAFLSNLDKVDNRLGDTVAQMKEAAKVDPFKDAVRSSVDLDKQAAKSIGNREREKKSFQSVAAEVKKLTDEKRKLIAREKEFIAAAKFDKYQRDIKKIDDQIKKLNGTIGKATTSTGGFGAKLKSAISTLSGGLLNATTLTIGGIATGLGTIAKRAFDAQAGFEGMKAQLEVGLKSQEDTIHNLTVLEKLAIRLPVALTDLTDNFAKLVNRGFKPTKDEIANLSGFAAAQNKTFDQLTEAILDAEVGELERLKEFGIQARNEGNKVQITFGNVTKTFVKGARESASAFAEMSKELGFDKLNDAKMQTLAGRLNNIGDQGDRILRLIGQALTPAFNFLFDIVSGGLSIIDNAVSGFIAMDDQLKKNVGTVNEQTYPAFERFFKLFSPDSEGRKYVSEFFLNLNGEWEIFKSQMSVIISQLEYYYKIYQNLMQLGTLGNGFGVNDFNQANEAARQQYLKDREAYDRNIAAIRQAREQALTQIYSGGGEGDLQYNALGDNNPTKTELDKAELKRLEDRKNALLKAQKDLEEEIKSQKDKYDQERIELLRNNEEEYLKAKYEYALKEIALEEQAYLRLKQLEAGARAGKFDKDNNPIADTSVGLSIEDEGIFANRRNAATDSYNTALAEAVVGKQKELTKELSDEYQRQLQDVEDKYEKLFAIAAKDEDALAKLRINKTQETNAILLQKDLDRLNNSERRELLAAEVELYDAQAQGRVDLEAKANRKLLEIQRDYLQARIALFLENGEDPNSDQVREMLADIAKLDVAIAKLGKTAKTLRDLFKDLFTKLGGNPEDFAAVEEFASAYASVLQDLFSVQQELTQRKIELIDREIDAKKAQIDKDRELNEKGYANNLDLNQKQLAELQKQREKAAKDQQRIQRLQLVADTATQASSLITASTGLFKALAPIPIVGLPLAIAAIATMFGAFAAAKIKSFQLAKQVPVFEKGGAHYGKRHSQGGELVEVEDGEYTINRKSTHKYRDLIEAINEDNSSAVMHHALQELKANVNNPLPQQQQMADLRQMRAYNAAMAQQKSEDTAILKDIRDRLTKIESSNERIPVKQVVGLGNNKVMYIDGTHTIVQQLPGED